MALEYAKDIVWEESLKKLENQIYIFGKQLHRMHRLDHKVDVIVTDSPLIHSAIYGAENHETFKNLILEEHNKFVNLNYFIKRSKEYNPNGRTQDLDGAIVVDNKILKFLKDHNINYKTLQSSHEDMDKVVDSIVYDVKQMLKTINKG
jgi:hypothetical protein